MADWKLVAAYLLNDETGSKTKEIENTYRGNVVDCRLEMIRLYLKGGDVSWQSVLSALRKAGYKNLADERKSPALCVTTFLYLAVYLQYL